MVVASPGIASIMYPTGQTAHTGSAIPIRIDEATTVGIVPESKLFKKIEELSLLIFDEISMISKDILDLIDQSFRLFYEKNEPFAGIRIVFAGDFRQILPVLTNGTPAQVVASSVKFKKCWRFVNTGYLTENIRGRGFGRWSAYLLRVGWIT